MIRKKRIFHFLCALVCGATMIIGSAMPASADTSNVIDCATKAATKAKLVTKCTTYESKNAVEGDIVNVRFSYGCPADAQTICITSGTKSVAAGVKTLYVEKDIPPYLPVALEYDGSKFVAKCDFEQLGSYSTMGQTFDIPEGTEFLSVRLIMSDVWPTCPVDSTHNGTTHYRSTTYLQIQDANGNAIGDNIKAGSATGNGDIYYLKNYPGAAKVRLYGTSGRWNGWTCSTCGHSCSSGSTGVGAISVVALKSSPKEPVVNSNLTAQKYRVQFELNPACVIPF